MSEDEQNEINNTNEPSIILKNEIKDSKDKQSFIEKNIIAITPMSSTLKIKRNSLSL